jgi:hypothetical protein
VIRTSFDRTTWIIISFVRTTLIRATLIRTTLIRTTLIRTTLIRTTLIRTTLIRTSFVRKWLPNSRRGLGAIISPRQSCDRDIIIEAGVSNVSKQEKNN